MTVHFRVTLKLLSEIHASLSRPHPFAAERVGFISCAAADLAGGGLLLLAGEFHPVADDHYMNDPRVGAMVGSGAIRAALQRAYQRPMTMFHVHRHEHSGRPGFSRIDLRESARFVPDFWKVRPEFPHGVIVLSHDSMAGLCWRPAFTSPTPINVFSVVGQPISTVEVAT